MLNQLSHQCAVSKVSVIPVVIGALGTISKEVRTWPEMLGIPDVIGSVQLSAILGTMHVLIIIGSFHSKLIPGHQFLNVFKLDPDMF